MAFKKYLRHRLKASLLRTVIFSLIAVLTTYVYVGLCVSPFFAVGASLYRGHMGLECTSVFMCAACLLIPVLETAQFKSRRNLDTLYSLPISRFNTALAHYVSGFLQVLAIYTSSFICMVLTSLEYAKHFNYVYLPAFYVLSVLFGLGFYSFVTFFFGEGNTVFDGAVFVFLGTVALMAVISLLYYYTDNGYRFFFMELSSPVPENSERWGMAFSPLFNLSDVFGDMVGASKEFRDNAEEIRHTFGGFYLWAAIYGACAFGYFRAFSRKGAEKTGEISSSFFGYKTLIPLFGFSLIIVNGLFDIASILYLAMMAVGYFIYRRGFRLKKSDVATLALAVLLMTLLQAGAVFFYWTGVVTNFIPLAAALAFFAFGVYRFTYALVKNKNQEGSFEKGEIIKRALVLLLSVALLAFVIYAGFGAFKESIRSIIYEYRFGPPFYIE